MTSAPFKGARRARAAIAALALVVAGCGFGEGEASEGEATLTVSRDYGAEVLHEATAEDPPATETVLRFLDDEAEVETRYGGGFVQSIDGIEGGVEDGRSFDWFFYVDGVESPVGAADVEVDAESRIWWDHHDWTDVMRVPAVVGSWPAPFATSATASVPCAAPSASACAEATERIEGAGAEVADADSGETEGPLVLVGAWDELRSDSRASALAGSPSESGVFARFERSGAGWELAVFDREMREAERLGPGAGLVAALEGRGESPTWLVTGTDAEGAEAAAESLDEASLSNRFAIAVPDGGEPLRLPVP